MQSRRAGCIVLCCAALVGASGTVSAGDYRIVPDESLIAVVTRKAGVAAGLAHDHLIVADPGEARLEFDPQRPLDSKFALSADATSLRVDPWDLQQRWADRLVELQVIADVFSEISTKNRAKIRRAMLEPRQLDAEAFPRIHAEVGRISRAVDDPDGFPFRVVLALEVRGRRVESEARARLGSDGPRVVVESLGTFRFTDFGIRPYSAMLGAVRNRDEFHVYAWLVLSGESP